MESSKLLNFWFKNEDKWFVKSDDFDNKIIDMFSSLLEKGLQDELDSWKTEAKSCLALVILFDQFPRNMFRNTKKMYFYDQKALSLAKYSIANKVDKKLNNDKQCQFLYMPLMHSEELEDQKLCVELFRKLDLPYALKYAEDHLKVIERFGRFPHRNNILERQSSEAEIDFMKKHSGY